LERWTSPQSGGEVRGAECDEGERSRLEYNFPMRILAISGSLRRASSNNTLLEAAQTLAPPGVRIDRHPGLDALPFFNPDLDADAPPAPVLELRREIDQSAALLICSPEYARGIAGVMKNALDWLVSCSEFPDKPVAVFNASQRATHADAQLKLTLTTMSARLIEAACITVPMLGRPLNAAGIVADESLAAPIRQALANLITASSDR
jgi:chromate reductase, NAD(P)H dehydrogenase (quinone)